MAIPTITAAVWGTPLSSGTSYTGVLPTHAANDILVFIPFCNGNDTITCSTSGWTKVAAYSTDANANMNFAFFWKRAASGAETAPVATYGVAGSSSNVHCGICFAVSGCITSGDPYEAGGKNPANPTLSANHSTPAVTTTGADRLIFGIDLYDDDNTLNATPAVTSGGWTAVTNGHQSTTTGGDSRHYAATIGRASAGTQASAELCTMNTASDYYQAIGLAFVPPAGGPLVVPAARADFSAPLPVVKHPITVPVMSISLSGLPPTVIQSLQRTAPPATTTLSLPVPLQKISQTAPPAAFAPSAPAPVVRGGQVVPSATVTFSVPVLTVIAPKDITVPSAGFTAALPAPAASASLTALSASVTPSAAPPGVSSRVLPTAPLATFGAAPPTVVAEGARNITVPSASAAFSALPPAAQVSLIAPPASFGASAAPPVVVQGLLTRVVPSATITMSGPTPTVIGGTPAIEDNNAWFILTRKRRHRQK